MSALTDLFTAMANKIRSKTGTATTYTPLEMVSDGIDDVYDAGYAAGGGGATGIPITPSNASPVSLTTGDSYEMLANGYAISSYNNLSPSNSTPAALADDTIYKTNGTGYAIDSYSSITPSNSSPVSLSSGAIYKMGGAGKAVASVTDITPSDSTPAALSSGTVYKAGGAGYAYATQQTSTSITPSDTSPAAMSANTKYTPTAAGYAIESSPTSITPASIPLPIAKDKIYRTGGAGYVINNFSDCSPSSSGASFSSGAVLMTSGGYAYTARPKNCITGTFYRGSSGTTTVNCGFQPKYIAIVFNGSSGSASSVKNGAMRIIYDYDFSSTYFQQGYKGSTGSNYIDTGTAIVISPTGFTLAAVSNAVFAGTYYYFAIA